MTKVTRLFDLIPNFLEHQPEGNIFGYKRDGEWKLMSISEYAEKANSISYGLLKLGLKKGDKIAVISGNRPEWNILDMAATQIGVIFVPIYPTISQDDYLHILNHAEVKLIFIEGKELRTKIEPILPQVPSIEHIYTFMDQGVYSYFAQLEELGKANPQPEKVAEISATVEEHDMATILYTSGTTGMPKGVMLSHANFLNNAKNVVEILADWDRRALSFLPLCHVYERTLNYVYQYVGLTTYYAENLGTISENIKEVDPNVMCCVPRVLEKVYDKLYTSGKKQPCYLQGLYFWAFDLACKYEHTGNSAWYKIRYKIADKLIYRKWREAIGGHFDIVISGGSAIQPHMSRFFSAIGMPCLEGYGLTESSPVIAVSRKGKNQWKAGTVGPALPGVEIKITEEGEVCCRGHNVMLGYYKDPEQTKQVIDEDGWLHTGDMGVFVQQGDEKLLKLTGRIKSLFKTSFGKYINPQKIEEKCCESPFIENMVVLGENQKFAAALIAPDFNFLKGWAARHKVPFSSNEEIIKNQVVIKRYRKEIQKYNPNFGDWEQVKKFELVPDEWSQATGILTPTQKVKRKVLNEKYADIIEKLFA